MDSKPKPIYSANDSKVSNTTAWIPLVNNPRRKTGTGIQSGTKLYSTAKVNSSARMLPKSRKLRESGFENSSKKVERRQEGHRLDILQGDIAIRIPRIPCRMLNARSLRPALR